MSMSVRCPGQVLAGYKVHVLGEVNSLVVKERAMKTARARKLPVVFHDEVPRAAPHGRDCPAVAAPSMPRGYIIVTHASSGNAVLCQVTKEEVLKRLCAASGVVLYAERDKNPRVAYEVRTRTVTASPRMSRERSLARPVHRTTRW